MLTEEEARVFITNGLYFIGGLVLAVAVFTLVGLVVVSFAWIGKWLYNLLPSL